MLKYSLLAFSLVVSTPAFALSFSNHFDNGDEGWTVGDIDNPLSTTRQAPSYSSTGGQSGGYIYTDASQDTTGFFGPSFVHGNGLVFYGGTLSFDLQDKIAADGSAYPALFLYGDGQVIAISGPAPGSTFTHYSFNLVETGFYHYQGGGRSPGTTPVSAADFKAVLSDFDGVAILADWHTGDNVTGLDNVTVATASTDPSPVPIPPAAPLFGAALLALGAFGGGLKRKAAKV